MANFHPNLTSGSRDNVYIRKITLKFWPIHQKKSQKSQKNGESLPFIRGNVLVAFPKKILVGSLTKKTLTFSFHCILTNQWQGRSAISPASMSKNFEQNVPQSVLSKMIIAAWLVFSASKRISQIKFPCSKL